ncbi:MAG TPA: B12-binding domain-containing radical SAM protein [Desulfobacteraceae bacterium]|nr:B12-binding domain-containing radical SAM protein [Desulfobacteraceae bacterium]
MKIVILEHPRVKSEKHFNDIANTPLWSCLLAGYAASALVNAGHDPLIMEAADNNWSFDKTKKELLAISPPLLCINGVYFWEHTQKLFDFVSDLRGDGYKGHINFFGFFPTLASKLILNKVPAVDSILLGEPEETLVHLADSIANGENFKQIKGIAVIDGENGFIKSRRPTKKNPDEIPFPLRCLKPGDTANILASRGCYNHCSFCPIPSFYNQGPLWRGRSPENITKEIKELCNMGITDFYFVDPNLIGPGKKGKERIKRLAELLSPLKISFGMETRADDLDKITMEKLADAGLKSLLIGIESGSSELLNLLDKSSSINQSEKAISICRDVGIEPEIGFLMFVPDSSIGDLENNISFLKKNRLLDRLERTVNLLSHYQIVMMGTSGYNNFAGEDRLIKSDPWGFEYEILFKSKKVKWVSDLVINTCRHLLCCMSDPDSPVFWRKSEDEKKFSLINNWVLEMFENLLVSAKKTDELPNTEPVKTKLVKDLNQKIKS